MSRFSTWSYRTAAIPRPARMRCHFDRCHFDRCHFDRCHFDRCPCGVGGRWRVSRCGTAIPTAQFPVPGGAGSNENTNALLRQYFPKGTSLAPFSQQELDAVAARLNSRPRRTLGWMTPSEKLAELVR
jgi:hypothetical protein